MAMNGQVLGDAILVAIDSTVAGSELTPALRTAIWRAIGQQIVLHIQTFAVVPVVVTSVSAVTVGVGVSGPGVGTGTVT